MTPALAALVALVVYALAYRLYSGWLARAVFHLDDARVTPAHSERDGVDYLPTRPSILFGHHFASITGLAPMLGPAVAVIWGWGPALVWVVLGAVLVGCVHDLAALVLSTRARGLSVGAVAEGVVGPRARSLFHAIIFFGITLAMGVFVFVIARLFSLELAPGHPGYPQAVLPSGLLMAVALVAGFLMEKRGLGLLPVATVGFCLELFGIQLGLWFPTLGLDPASWPGPAVWTGLLLAYALAASVLPVWSLLQPRDFLNALLLYLGLGLAYLGLFVANPAFDAPAFVPSPEGAPPLLPFVFIVIACGAASGFHGLVSSGTTSKQLERESHARPVAYGAMIGESLLGLLATLACTAGFGSSALWHEHYGSWGAAQGLTAKIDAFIQGTTTFLTALGLPPELGAALIAMVVVSFALTTLDSATRLLRFNIEEIGASLGLQAVTGNRFVSGGLAVAAIAFFATYEVNGKPAALALWTLFGTTNQLLAGLTLGLASLYLRERGWPVWPVALPCVFVLGSTLVGMVMNLRAFATGPTADPLLLVVGGTLALLGLWLLIEAALVLRQGRRTRQATIEV